MIKPLPPACAAGSFHEPSNEEYAALRLLVIYDINLTIASGWVRRDDPYFWIEIESMIVRMLNGISSDGAWFLAGRLMVELQQFYAEQGWEVEHGGWVRPSLGQMDTSSRKPIRGLRFVNPKA